MSVLYGPMVDVPAASSSEPVNEVLSIAEINSHITYFETRAYVQSGQVTDAFLLEILRGTGSYLATFKPFANDLRTQKLRALRGVLQHMPAVKLDVFQTHTGNPNVSIDQVGLLFDALNGVPPSEGMKIGEASTYIHHPLTNVVEVELLNVPDRTYLERGLARMTHLIVLKVGCPDIDATLLVVNAMQSLRTLVLRNCGTQLTPAHAAQLSLHKGIVRLALQNTVLSPAFLTLLCKGMPQLEMLEVSSGIALTDAEMQSLTGLESLQFLSIERCDMSECTTLPQSPSLVALHMRECDLQPFVFHSLDQLRNLVELDVRGNVAVGPISLIHLGRLRALDVSDTSVKISNLVAHLPNLETLTADSILRYHKIRMTDAMKLSRIKTLSLASNGLKDGDAAFLGHLSLLESVNLYGNNVTNDTLYTLNACAALKRVNLSNTNVDPEGVMRILPPHVYAQTGMSITSQF